MTKSPVEELLATAIEHFDKGNYNTSYGMFTDLDKTHNDPIAQYYLAKHWDRGWAVKHEDEYWYTPDNPNNNHMKYLKKSAEQGYAPAQIDYADGLCSYNDDFEGAIPWLEQAAAQGYIVAHRELGDIYGEGHAGYIDQEKAKHHYQIAADAGDTNAKDSIEHLERFDTSHPLFGEEDWEKLDSGKISDEDILKRNELVHEAVITYQHDKDYSKSLELFEQAFALDPDAGYGHSERGNVYFTMMQERGDVSYGVLALKDYTWNLDLSDQYNIPSTLEEIEKLLKTTPQRTEYPVDDSEVS